MEAQYQRPKNEIDFMDHIKARIDEYKYKRFPNGNFTKNYIDSYCLNYKFRICLKSQVIDIRFDKINSSLSIYISENQHDNSESAEYMYKGLYKIDKHSVINKVVKLYDDEYEHIFVPYLQTLEYDLLFITDWH